MGTQAALATIVLCVVLSCLNSADAGFGFGPCSPKREAVKDFKLEKYTSRWYEISSFGAWFEWNGKCVQAEYSLRPDGLLDVFNIMINKSSAKKTGIRGSAVTAGSPGEGKLAVTFPTWLGNRTGPYWVLGTDYDNYSVVYACSDLKVAHYDFGWILSRQPTLSQQHMSEVEAVLAANDLQPSQFSPTVQDCGILTHLDI